MRVEFLGIGAEYEEVRQEVLVRMGKVLETQQFVLGEQTRELETSIADLAGVPHAVACSSGSDALALALMAIGVGHGDAVLVPSFTFFATAGAVARLGAVPVMADVDPLTQNMGASELAAAMERAFRRESGGHLFHRGSGAQLKAVIVVHLYGRAAPMRELNRLADDLDVPVIEDAAQAIGALSDCGPVGSVGRIACFSFYPTKNLGGAGDGGMLTTSDEALAQRLSRLRVHGAVPGGYVHEDTGMNGRMGELQAAYLNAKLPRLKAWTESRVTIADEYRRRLSELENSGLCILPAPADSGSHVYHQFVIRISAGRDAVAENLRAGGIDCRVFYPLPLHLQPCFASLGYGAGALPGAEQASREVLALPIGVHIGSEDVESVCESLERAIRA